MSAATPEFSTGDVVKLVGLKARPELNGKRGRVLGEDSATGRIKVALPSEAVKVKADNLRKVPAAKTAATSPWYGTATAVEPEAALQFVIDSARLRVEDEYVQCGDAVGAYAEGAGERGEAMRWFKRYVRAAVARGVLPPWWTGGTTAALYLLAYSTATVTMNGKQHGFYIRHAVEAHDVAAVWGQSGLVRLRELAASILGPVHSPFSDEDDHYLSIDDCDPDFFLKRQAEREPTNATAQPVEEIPTESARRARADEAAAAMKAKIQEERLAESVRRANADEAAEVMKAKIRQAMSM